MLIRGNTYARDHHLSSKPRLTSPSNDVDFFYLTPAPDISLNHYTWSNTWLLSYPIRIFISVLLLILTLLTFPDLRMKLPASLGRLPNCHHGILIRSSSTGGTIE